MALHLLADRMVQREICGHTLLNGCQRHVLQPFRSVHARGFDLAAHRSRRGDRNGHPHERRACRRTRSLGEDFLQSSLCASRPERIRDEAIFCYGSEQGIANWISKFLSEYHGFNPQVEGARAVAMFWGLMTVGCLLGLVLLKLFDSRKVLIGFAAAAILTLTAALAGGAALSYYSFMTLGFFLSVMWSSLPPCRPARCSGRRPRTASTPGASGQRHEARSPGRCRPVRGSRA